MLEYKHLKKMNIFDCVVLFSSRTNNLWTLTFRKNVRNATLTAPAIAYALEQNFAAIMHQAERTAAKNNSVDKQYGGRRGMEGIGA